MNSQAHAVFFLAAGLLGLISSPQPRAHLHPGDGLAALSVPPAGTGTCGVGPAGRQGPTNAPAQPTTTRSVEIVLGIRSRDIIVTTDSVRRLTKYVELLSYTDEHGRAVSESIAAAFGQGGHVAGVRAKIFVSESGASSHTMVPLDSTERGQVQLVVSWVRKRCGG